MICAAVSGETATRIMHWTTSMIQTNSGMRPSVMPGQRMVRIVVAMLTAAGDAADPDDDEAEDPVVGALPREKAVSVSGA